MGPDVAAKDRMAEPRAREIEELAAAIAGLSPPAGARERVFRALEQRLERRRRRALWLAAVFFPAAAVAAVAVWQVAGRSPRPSRPRPAPILSAPERPGAPARPARAPATRPVDRPAEPRVGPPAPTRRARPSSLARQVAAYRRALALQGQDDRSALERFRQMRSRWPHGPLAHEVDLRIIETLLRLKRVDAARAEARRFLARHPHSPKADHVGKLVRSRSRGGDAAGD